MRMTVSRTGPVPGRTTVMRARSKATIPAALLSNAGATARWPDRNRGAVESRRQLRMATVASRNQTARRVTACCRSPAPLDEHAEARTKQGDTLAFVVELPEGQLRLHD